MSRSLAFKTALLALLAVPAASSVAVPVQPVEPRFLRGSECLDPAFARSFATIDYNTLVVDAGRYRYLIQTGACWGLDYTNIINFRGDPISRRVCGGTFDAILVRNEPPCRIERMSLIDKQQYDEALDRRKAWLRERKEANKARRAKGG